MQIVDLEAELASIFAQTGTPEFVQTFLLRQKPPVNSTDLFANVVSSPEELMSLILEPAGFNDETILLPEARLHCRGAVASAWRLAEASFKNKKSPNNDERTTLLDSPIDLNRRSRMLARFHDIYKFQIPIADQPSDRTLSIAHHLWTKRSFEFVPLSMVSAVNEQDSSWLGSQPRKIQGTDLLYAPMTQARKNDLWMKSPPCFAHTIKVLMYSYVLASAQDPDENQWLSLSSALLWLEPVEKLACLGSRSQDPLFAKISEVEAAARKEWLAMSQRDPMQTLSEVIVESLRNIRYPLPSEFVPKLSAEQQRKRSWLSDSSAGASASTYTGAPAMSFPKSKGKGSLGADAARAALLGEEQKRIARARRMNELARNTGFVEETPEDRSCIRPVDCHNSQKPKGCNRGDACRYCHSPQELRLVKELTRQNRKVKPLDLRSGRVENLPNVQQQS